MMEHQIHDNSSRCKLDGASLRARQENHLFC
jgi:hypothetical protein